MWFRSIWFIGGAFGIILAAAPQVLWTICAIIGRIGRFRVPYAPFGCTNPFRIGCPSEITVINFKRE